MKQMIPFCLLAISCVALYCCQGQPTGSVSNTSSGKNKALVGGPCDGCDILFDGIPGKILSTDTSAGWYEAGQKILIHGKVYRPDGKTPAAGVILYYHQTDNTGHYTPSPDQQGAGRRHGHLRGWLRTDENGNYALYTIKPAPYPNANIPAHIHIYVKEPQVSNVYWIDDITFDDDPLMTVTERNRQQNRAGSGIVKLAEQDGLWQTRRDLILGLNIPDYPATR